MIALLLISVDAVLLTCRSDHRADKSDAGRVALSRLALVIGQLNLRHAAAQDRQQRCRHSKITYFAEGDQIKRIIIVPPSQYTQPAPNVFMLWPAGLSTTSVPISCSSLGDAPCAANRTQAGQRDAVLPIAFWSSRSDETQMGSTYKSTSFQMACRHLSICLRADTDSGRLRRISGPPDRASNAVAAKLREQRAGLDRNLPDAHIERRQRILDRRCDRRRQRNDAGFAHAFHAERIERRRRFPMRDIASAAFRLT